MVFEINLRKRKEFNGEDLVNRLLMIIVDWLGVLCFCFRFILISCVRFWLRFFIFLGFLRMMGLDWFFLVFIVCDFV